MSKKHEFKFTTSKGDVTVATDDVRELSSSPWFSDFLGLGETTPKDQKLLTEYQDSEREVRELRMLLNEAKTQMREDKQKMLDMDDQLKQMKRHIDQLQGGRQQSQPQQQQTQQPQQAPSQQQSQMPQQAQPQQTLQQQSGQPTEAEIMALDPDHMTSDIWSQLSPSQRYTWAKKWNQLGQ